MKLSWRAACWTVAVVLTFAMLAGLAHFQARPKWWVVCYLDVGGPVCPHFVKALSYRIEGNCVRFSTDATFCNIFGVVPYVGSEEKGKASGTTSAEAR